MENQVVHQKTRCLFEAIETCNTIDALNELIRKEGRLADLERFYEKYPDVDFTVLPKEIESLKASGIIDDHNNLLPEKFPSDPLVKLLAAALWKNGDLNKVQHLVDGITGQLTDRSTHALVFKQFGASLTSVEEPIVDQHVLRAFEIYQLQPYSEEAVSKSRRKSVYKTSDKSLLNQYRSWFQLQLKKVSSKEKTDYKKRLDKIIFLHGKEIKF